MGLLVGVLGLDVELVWTLGADVLGRIGGSSKFKLEEADKVGMNRFEMCCVASVLMLTIISDSLTGFGDPLRKEALVED